MSGTVGRAVEIIEFIAEKPRSLTEIALQQDVHKSTALRLLQTLESYGFARRDSVGRYTVGFRMIALSQQALDNIDIYGVAHPHLLALSAELGHTMHVAHLVGNDVTYVDKVDGRGAVKMYSRVGANAIIHTSGVGKAILANLEPPLFDQVFATLDFKKYTGTTITKPKDFIAELDLTRRRGWAEDNGEFEAMINCVAVPIRDSGGLVRSAFSLTALRALASLDTLREYVTRMQETASKISIEIGWVG
jgi:DNA-binding IclR family transcriptional regulator